ncbi:MAG: methanogenesis marker 12 protein, partial [Methanoregulaceae archaeon]|nr:methanogenesis marker 12 protein [Methanoregulaceae archaeon]
RLGALALFSAMECAALLLLNPKARVAIAGSIGPLIAGEVSTLLDREVAAFDEWCASSGLALIARDVFSGNREILGISVDM